MPKSARVNYHNRRFAGTPDDHEDFTAETTFHYRQAGEVVWGTYNGGRVLFGTLVATIDENGCLDMRCQYVSTRRELITKACLSVPEQLADGRLRMHQVWRAVIGEEVEGTSVIEETRPEKPGGGASKASKRD